MDGGRKKENKLRARSKSELSCVVLAVSEFWPPLFFSPFSCCHTDTHNTRLHTFSLSTVVTPLYLSFPHFSLIWNQCLTGVNIFLLFFCAAVTSHKAKQEWVHLDDFSTTSYPQGEKTALTFSSPHSQLRFRIDREDKRPEGKKRRRKKKHVLSPSSSRRVRSSLPIRKVSHLHGETVLVFWHVSLVFYAFAGKVEKVKNTFSFSLSLRVPVFSKFTAERLSHQMFYSFPPTYLLI